MNPFTTLLGLHRKPLDFLAHFDREEALNAGMDPALVKKWGVVHNVYFGRTKWSAQQKRARIAAQSGGFTDDKLYLIEQRISHVQDPRERWALRLELLSTKGRFNALKRQAEEIIPPKEKPAPKKTLSFGKTRQGMRPLNAMAPEKEMAALEFALRQRVSSNRPAGPQMVDVLLGMLGLGSQRPDAAADASAIADAAARIPSAYAPAVPAVPRPLIVIPLSDYTKIISGDGDETILGLSDGTTITGAEYLAEHHGKELEVALFHPQEGAVNLYSTSRFANQKQRDLARATLTTCPVPDCRHASDNCEIHHVTAWSRGGPTNMSNLAPVCQYHNRTNDDDPERTHRGRITFIRGRPIWRSPRGYPVANKVHPFGAMTLLFGQ